MGNALFRCCTTTTKAGRVRGKRQSLLLEDVVSTWGRGAPSKRSRRIEIKEFPTSSYQRPSGGGRFSENLCPPGWRESATHRRPAKSASRPRFTSRASIPQSQESLCESLLHPVNDESSPTSRFSPANSSPPDLATKFNPLGCQQLQNVDSPTSYSSPISDSPDTTRMSLNQHGYQRLDANCQTSRSPLMRDSSRDFVSMSFDQDCYQQLNAHSPTSRASPKKGSSPDTKRRSFNQHCHQQRYLTTSPKRRQSPRRQNKSVLGKPSRRKRSGLRSPYRISYSKSPRNASIRRIDDNDDRRTAEMRSTSRMTSNTKSLGRIFNDNEDKTSDASFRAHTTTNFKTLARALEESIGEIEDMRNSMFSPSHSKSYSRSAGRPADLHMEDNKRSGSSCKVSAASPISRRAVAALLRRRRGFDRMNGMRSSQHCRRQWKPDLDSIPEAADWEKF